MYMSGGRVAGRLFFIMQQKNSKSILFRETKNGSKFTKNGKK